MILLPEIVSESADSKNCG